MLTRTLTALTLSAATTLTYAQTSPLQPIADEGALQEPTRASSTTLPQVSLIEVLGLAARSNPLLRGARADSDASAGALMQAGVRPNPELSFLQEGFGGTERTSTATVNQRIELGGKRQARLDVASYGREVALAALDGRGSALRADVISAFYEELAAQRQEQVARESADIAARSADLAEKRSRAGKVSPVEATKARIAASAVHIEVTNAAARVMTARERLASVTGNSQVRGSAAGGDIESVPSLQPLSVLVSQLNDSPGSRVARAEMLRSDAAISVERAKRIPDITVSAGMKRVITGGVSDNQAVIGVSIPLPLFDTNKGALLEAAHKAEKASADFDNERLRLQLELTRAYANYETSVQAARRLKDDVLPASKDALNAMSRGFELGKFAFLDVLDAQRTLFQAQSQYVQALTEAHLAYAEVGRLVGTPLPAVSLSTNTLP
ncbi:TolC family protein [Caballeronia sp. Lep1P3]|uniref:TolC family protein n=1 Tax=Caballeronia sp. Lep1P3 TaxID=2878150 RepID=UPI00029C2EF1|nr:TolC family protein [Caballeronia sp. Lep1P3]EKS72763.1 outer membrane efflux protein [Burkholderia sp. SJ98]